MPWYALRQNYCDVIAQAGGVPIALPHNPQLSLEYAAQLDGLVLTGGNFDIDPALYGVTDVHETVTMKPARTAFEFAIMKAMYQSGKPILGICGGMQLINVCMGGSLIQHIPAEVVNSLPHEQPNPRNEPGHDVFITTDSLLYAIGGVEQASVNSAHHQAVKSLGEGLTITAKSSDGVIEAIETIDKSQFLLGVQWHPEYEVCDLDSKIFNRFIENATQIIQ